MSGSFPFKRVKAREGNRFYDPPVIFCPCCFYGELEGSFSGEKGKTEDPPARKEKGKAVGTSAGKSGWVYHCEKCSEVFSEARGLAGKQVEHERARIENGMPAGPRPAARRRRKSAAPEALPGRNGEERQVRLFG